MSEKKQEVTEIIVKPNKSYGLDLTNKIKKGLYTILNQGGKLCEVYERSDALLGLSINPFTLGIKEDHIHGVADIRRDPSVQFSDKRVDVDGCVEKKKVTGEGNYSYGLNFETYHLTDMDGIIELDNGKFLINKYGKYLPNLSFINDIPEIKFEPENPDRFNLPKGSLSVIYGDYFTSKKGTKCFRVLPKEKAKHILIRDSWGGAFNNYRGRILSEDKALYYRRASSNGRGLGCDYGIYDKNFRNILSEDDI